MARSLPLEAPPLDGALEALALGAAGNVDHLAGFEALDSQLGADFEGLIAIRQADHISDLLRTVPGVDVGGSHSLNQRVTIRSLGDRNLRVSIDGANQNNYMYHHMGNLQIHADILQSVNIDVGTNSVVDGGLGGLYFIPLDAASYSPYR